MAVDLDVPAAPRHHPDRRRHRRPRRHQPGPAQHPRPGRHRPGHGGALPRRLALQHHQPDDRLTRVGVPGDRDQDGRPLPRGRQLLHGPGHRPRPALRGGLGVGDRRQPLPGAHRRSRSTARTGSTCCASWSTRSAAWSRWRPYPGRPEAEKFSKLDFAQRHLLQADAARPLGHLPGGRRPAHRRVRPVRADPGVGVGCGVQHRAQPDLAARGAPGRVHRRRRRLAGRHQGPADVAVGRAALADDRGHAHRRARSRPRSTSPTPARPSDLPGRRRGRVDLRDRRRRHPRPRRAPRCRRPTTRSCAATSPPRSSPSRPR